MEKRKPVRVFDLEGSYAGGGGTYFAAGLYKVMKSLYVKYDFNGKGKENVCLCQDLQPLNAAREDAGDSKTQYWPIGLSSEVDIVNKGKEIVLTGERETIWKLSDFYVYMDQLKKAGYDVDGLIDDNDITALTGLVAEFGMVPDPKDKLDDRRTLSEEEKKKAEEKKKFGPKTIIVVTAIPASKGGKPESKKSDSKKKGADDDSGSKGSSDYSTAITEFLAKSVLNDKAKEDGVERLQVRVKLNNWVNKEYSDVDDAKAVKEIYNDAAKMKSITAAMEWALDGDKYIFAG